MTPTLSLCMVVKNEELLLGRCLKSALPYVDEAIIVDTGSTDRTVAIAKRAGARVIRYRWDGSLGRARELSIREAQSDWIFVLDGDEEMTPCDIKKLRRSIQTGNADAFLFQVHNYTRAHDLLRGWQPVRGKYPREEKFSQSPGWWSQSALRAFKNDRRVHYEEGFSVHTNVLKSLKKIRARILPHSGVIHHYQILKGGEKFVSVKQDRRVRNELRHLKLFPDEGITYLNLGKYYLSISKYREALKYLQSLIQLPRSSFHAEGYLVMGLAQLHLHRPEEARKCLIRSIKLEPKNADAWAVLGITAEIEGDADNSERHLKHALKLSPWHPIALNSLGVVYREKGQFVRAKKSFRKALQYCPFLDVAKKNLKEVKF